MNLLGETEAGSSNRCLAPREFPPRCGEGFLHSGEDVLLKADLLPCNPQLGDNRRILRIVASWARRTAASTRKSRTRRFVRRQGAQPTCAWFETDNRYTRYSREGVVVPGLRLEPPRVTLLVGNR